MTEPKTCPDCHEPGGSCGKHPQPVRLCPRHGAAEELYGALDKLLREGLAIHGDESANSIHRWKRPKRTRHMNSFIRAEWTPISEREFLKAWNEQTDAILKTAVSNL